MKGDSAFGPGIYDMKGGAYLAFHAFRELCAGGERSPLDLNAFASQPIPGLVAA